MVRATLPKPQLSGLATGLCLHGTIGLTKRSPADFRDAWRRCPASTIRSDRKIQRTGNRNAERRTSETMGSPTHREAQGDRGPLVLKSSGQRPIVGGGGSWWADSRVPLLYRTGTRR